MPTAIDKNDLKRKILHRYELYKLNNSRLKRLLKDPIRTGIFYIMALLAYLKPYRVYKKTLWGQNMTYFLPEANALQYYGFFEANLTNFLINFLKPGNTFLDIGAHVGYYSMLASHLVDINGKVYSLEPTPRTFHSLQLNSQLAKNKNVFPFNLAALDKKTTIDFLDYGPKYSAFNTFENRQENNYTFLHKEEKHISVPTTDIDNFCQENNVTPEFIKIDAEGAEYKILQGMKYTLTSIRPLISIEITFEKEWEQNKNTSIAILEENNYQIFEADLNGNLKNPKFIPDISNYDNLIAVPKEKIAMLKELISEEL
jgi:FkbM family methyltransferase